MASLERLLVVIDAYGGDPARWPEAERAELEAVAARHPEARMRIAEARALDAVLAQSLVPDRTRLDGLSQRILAAVGDNAGLTGPAAVAPRSDKIAPMRRPSRNPDLHAAWPVAAALAASLLIGVYFGTSETARPAIEEIVASAGFDVSDVAIYDPFGTTEEGVL